MSVRAALERVLRTSRRIVAPGDRVFVAVGGGKDSAVVLYVLSELRRGREFNLRAFHIDLGLVNALPIVKDLAERLNVELHVVSIGDYGIDIARASKLLRRPPCSICGTVKRYLMNRVPRELGATKLATGHNTDDILTFFMKDLAMGRIEWASKLKPITPSTHPKLLTKIMPLFEVTGEETLAIAESLGLPFTRDRCPLAPPREEWIKESVKAFTTSMDERHKGFIVMLVRGIARMPEITEVEAIRECKLCGEPTSTEVYSFCRIRLALSPLNKDSSRNHPYLHTAVWVGDSSMEYL